MTLRRATPWVMLLGLGCGPEVILHDDGGSTTSEEEGGTTTADGTSTDGSDPDGSSGELPPPVPPGEGPYGGGTRLAPVVERTEDGVELLSHWYDRELGIECTFARDALGDVRCLPLPVEGIDVGFADEGCTQPAMGMLGCDVMPTFVRAAVLGAAACGEGRRHEIYQRGEALGAGRLSVPSASSGVCAPGEVLPTRYAMTPVDHAQFVMAAESFEAQGSLRVRALVAEDGAWVRDRLVNPDSDTVCPLRIRELDADEGTVVHLCEVPRATLHGYGDAACTQQIARLEDDGTCRPSMLPVAGHSGEWWALGPAWEGARYDLEDEDMCMESEPEPFGTHTYVELAEPIAPIEPVRVAHAPASGDPGRLQRLGVEAGGDVVVLPDVFESDLGMRWYDALLGERCAPLATAGGQLRCFPWRVVEPSALDAWGDPECTTTPLYRTVETESFARVTLATSDGCGNYTVEGMQNVVGPWEGPVYRASNGGPCEPIEVGDFERVLQLGNVVPLTDAPALDLVTGP